MSMKGSTIFLRLSLRRARSWKLRQTIHFTGMVIGLRRRNWHAAEPFWAYLVGEWRFQQRRFSALRREPSSQTESGTCLVTRAALPVSGRVRPDGAAEGLPIEQPLFSVE